MSGPYVYDKAKYHYGGDYPDDLPEEQAFVHTGLYLGWLIERDLISEEFRQESGGEIEAFKARQLTGPEIYQQWDGALTDDMLSEEGNTFSREYFDFETGQFLADYVEILGEGLDSLYYVENSWANYERLKVRLDDRYTAWKRHKERKRWTFWRK